MLPTTYRSEPAAPMSRSSTLSITAGSPGSGTSDHGELSAPDSAPASRTMVAPASAGMAPGSRPHEAAASIKTGMAARRMLLGRRQARVDLLHQLRERPFRPVDV